MLMLIGIILVTISTLLFGLFSYHGFYYAFKKYESDDDFVIGITGFELLELIMTFILSITKKFLSRKNHIIWFKICSFIFGTIMLFMVILFWGLFSTTFF